MIRNPLHRYPVTITLSLLAVIIHAIPSLAESLQLDFLAVGDGQWWRMFTGHLTHFDGEHLFWDLLMFFGLAGICEKSYPRQIAPAILAMAGGISLGVWLFCPQVNSYRGLSGIDTGLFVWLAGMRLLDCLETGDRVVGLIWIMPVVGLVAKLCYEATTGQTLFVDSGGFTPLVEAHLVGVAIGMMVCIATTFRQKPRKPSLATTC